MTAVPSFFKVDDSLPLDGSRGLGCDVETETGYSGKSENGVSEMLEDRWWKLDRRCGHRALRFDGSDNDELSLTVSQR
jgi:hypothetical protein